MKHPDEVLDTFPLLEAMERKDRQSLSAHFEEATYEPGDRIYAEGDAVASVFLLVSGVVDLVAMLETGVEHRFLTLREGSEFGVLTLVGSGIASGSAVVMETAEVLSLGREQLAAWEREHPTAALALWRGICATAGRQMQTIADDYRRITGWARQVAAVSGLDLQSLAADGRELTIELLSGTSIQGRVLKTDTDPAGTILTLALPDGSIQIVPFHAVGVMALADPLPPASADNPMV